MRVQLAVSCSRLLGQRIIAATFSVGRGIGNAAMGALSQSSNHPITQSLNKKERAVSGPLFGMASGLGGGLGRFAGGDFVTDGVCYFEGAHRGIVGQD